VDNALANETEAAGYEKLHDSPERFSEA